MTPERNARIVGGFLFACAAILGLRVCILAVQGLYCTMHGEAPTVVNDQIQCEQL